MIAKINRREQVCFSVIREKESSQEQKFHNSVIYDKLKKVTKCKEVEQCLGEVRVFLYLNVDAN